MKVMIVGAGKLGVRLIEVLLNGDFEIVVVDQNIRVIERVKTHFDVMTLHANGLELGNFKELDISSFELFLSFTDSDETNVLICSLAKKMGCIKTVARVRSPEMIEQLEYLRNDLGVDHFLNPEFITAREMTRTLLKPYGLAYETFIRGQLSFVSMPARHLSDFLGKTVEVIEQGLPVQITAVSSGQTIEIPSGNHVVHEDETLHFAGLTPDIDQLLHHYGTAFLRGHIRNVMIIGGGRTAFYLAKLLSRAKMQITVVEHNRERCNTIAEKLPHVLVIHGDGTDMTLLEEEGLRRMDAFIGVTNDDEKNILMSLLARQYQIHNTMTSLNSGHYFQLVHKIGLEGALSPVNMTISSILKFIRGDRVASLALIHGGQAEVTEIRMDESTSLVNQPLSKIKLPKGVRIIGIERDKRVFFPESETVIKSGDRLVVLCLTQSIKAMELFFRHKKGGLLDELWTRR